jgi:hypothetical protein
MCCSSTQEDSSPSACLRGLARHFKTEPTETVELCFGYPKTPCRRAEGKLSTSVDEHHIRTLVKRRRSAQGVFKIRWDFNEVFLFHVAHRKYLPLDGARIRYRPFERQMPVDIQRPSSALNTVLPPLDLFLRCSKKNYRCSRLGQLIQLLWVRVRLTHIALNIGHCGCDTHMMNDVEKGSGMCIHCDVHSRRLVTAGIPSKEYFI